MPPPDPSTLYGRPRPKNKPIPLSSTSIHALSTELLALSRSARTAPARPRPEKSTNPLFSGPKSKNKGVAARAARDLSDSAARGTSLTIGSVEERDLERSRQRLKEKAREYERLKRGHEEEGGGGGGLVDFDRKWAEEGEPDDDDEEEEEEEEEVEVEYEDEFGRTRKGTRSEAAAAEREKEKAKALAQHQELAATGQVAGRTTPPRNVIYTAEPQAHAIKTVSPGRRSREEEQLESHYDASKEVRTKGVGFYQFSTDGEVREKEMAALEEERRKTEEGRKERERKKRERREEVERRREEVKKRRRGKVGEGWLEKEFGDLGGVQDDGEVKEEKLNKE